MPLRSLLTNQNIDSIQNSDSDYMTDSHTLNFNNYNHSSSSNNFTSNQNENNFNSNQIENIRKYLNRFMLI